MSTSERNFARRIDLTSLQLFVAVCELGSIGRAAEREFIAASAISKRLSDLEATLGTTLLYRHARGVDLTPAGESLLHHARSVLYSLEKMQGELSEYADGVRGHVRRTQHLILACTRVKKRIQRRLRVNDNAPPIRQLHNQVGSDRHILALYKLLHLKRRILHHA